MLGAVHVPAQQPLERSGRCELLGVCLADREVLYWPADAVGFMEALRETLAHLLLLLKVVVEQGAYTALNEHLPPRERLLRV